LKTAPNKKAPLLAGLFSGVLTTTSFSSSPSSLLELFSLLPFSISPPILALSLRLLLTSYG